ncbi:flagellin [Rhodovulum marinum]|uniref:Flagellar hook-associated protein 3 FlgL n=1 Tax=Rhodovulum marinum TaxID=320662 RepID=A0A4R2PVG3_9RHOB|nr:flagellin [Rhodovulum marinum]TCP39088.1 flagellar hook-associated protein 3 FlgL [Rhodovulum marinum]
MSFVSIGDLSRGFAMRTQNAEIKARLSRLGEEVTTGVTANPAERLRGDFRALGAIERSLAVMDSYDLATKEAALTTDAMQTALSRLYDTGQTLSGSMLNASTMHDARTVNALGRESKERLDLTVATLNIQVGGRSLFAGAATDSAALASGADILAEVQTAIAGLTTANDVVAAIDAWFDTPGGGFETVGYIGSDNPAGPVRLNEGNSMTLDVTASDPVIRDVLKGLVAGALLSDENLFSGDLDERAELLGAAGEQLLTNTAELVSLQGEIGVAQARIETIGTENAASRQMLDLARLDMLSVDPYDAATEFQAVEAQLETVYTITARLSRLSLADYI